MSCPRKGDTRWQFPDVEDSAQKWAGTVRSLKDQCTRQPYPGGETMLSSKRPVLLTLVTFVSLGISSVAYATGEVTIDITGCPRISGTANPSFTFPATPCPSVNPVLTVAGTVSAISDTAGGTLDILKFTGTITANQNVSQAEIKIRRVFAAGPNTASGSVYYKTCSAGTLTQDTNRTNSFTLTGSAENGGYLRQMGAQIFFSSNQGSSFTCTVGSTTTTGQWTTPPALGGDRTLQADLFVNILAGGSMNLSGVNYIKIQSQGSADDIPVPSDKSCLGLFTQCTTQSTTRLFSSPSEEVGDDVKAKTFARASWENLTADIARGEGEYLSSLASLLKVQPEDQLNFVALAQAHYRRLQEQGKLIPEAFVEGLREELLATPPQGKVATFVGY